MAQEFRELDALAEDLNHSQTHMAAHNCLEHPVMDALF